VHCARIFTSWVAAFVIIFVDSAESPNVLVAADSMAERHAKADARLTPANYNKITNGMTIAEVEAIFDDRPPFRMGKEGDWTYTWHLWSDWKRRIDIHFKDGAVDRKSNAMKWGLANATTTPPKAKTDNDSKPTRPPE
jgi:hypothetical protein